MAKYDIIYPDAVKGFVSNRHDKQPPVLKFDYAEAQDRKEEPMCACGERTSWVNPSAMQYVWNALIANFVATQISGAF
jgi:hypothetical protein